MPFSKGAGDNTLKFPLTAKAIKALSPSSLASPRPGKPHGLHLPDRLKNLTQNSDAVLEVLEVRGEVARGQFSWDYMRRHYPKSWGEFPSIIPAPLARKGLSFENPQGLAHVVHMDSPVDLGLAIGSWLRSEGAKAVNLESPDHTPFLDMVPGPLARMAVQCDEALERAFAAKYYFGVARPEEASGFNCTHYPEGCPTHPSYPAGHGAAAGATAAHYEQEWKLTGPLLKVVRDAAYCWAQFRTFAGVHYAEDNVMGLQIGGLDVS